MSTLVQQQMESSADERYFLASQWQLMWRKLKKHRLALLGGIILIIFYISGLLCEVIAPYEIFNKNTDYIYCPPQKIHFFDGTRFHLRPFVYGLEREIDMELLKRIYKEDKSRKYFIKLFVRGDEYKFWGLFKTDIHLFGVDRPGTLYIFGTDDLGRDMLSRNLYASRISLSIGLVGVAFSFILGLIFGGLSGYYGGPIDTVIQRIIEFLISIPKIPLWMALSAALPPNWPSINVYFGITIILSMAAWTGLARVVRGRLLELREEDFVMAAKISGATDPVIIARHLLPSFLSYLIVNLTLSIPRMILAETALSFLGLGLRPPVVSWGVLLQKAQNFQAVVMAPWLLLPGTFVVFAVLAFNVVGDGMRDAADPYAN